MPVKKEYVLEDYLYCNFDSPILFTEAVGTHKLNIGNVHYDNTP